jgi:hypothetical protein
MVVASRSSDAIRDNCKEIRVRCREDRAFLLDPHPKMPDVSLARLEAAIAGLYRIASETAVSADRAHLAH